MFIDNKKKSTSIIDYSLLIAAVVTTLIIMGLYLKRGISGNLKESADTFGHGRQYDGEFIRPEVN